MRNVLVVLVPLCIGLTSGFIVPSGIHGTLFSDVDSNSFECNKIKRRDIKAQNINDNRSNTEAKSSTSKTLIIENSKNNKLDEDLYKDINEKDVNVNERSFIYINQRTKQPLQNHIFLNIIPKERVDSSETNTSYLLNRNNVFEEFHRRYLIGRTYIDKNKVDNNFASSKSKNQYNMQTKNTGKYKKTSDSNSNHQDVSNVSKGKGKYLISYTDPFLKLYVKNVTNTKIVTLKPDAKYYRHMFTLKPSIKLSDNRLDLNLKEKLSLSTNNLYDTTMYLEKGKQQNTISIKTESLERQNNTQIDRYGFYFCLDCIKKLKKQNFKNPLFIKKNCICRRENALKKQPSTQI
ncbi:unnamed protein product [Euphydryas editha]|uniref:Uncharacterized protein n=1 Tax=Euphydryas editha TaxID=104508 RepID=A0AAU9U655_EUPED|nr:unnamed protein product [Euphydryas editha]